MLTGVEELSMFSPHPCIYTKNEEIHHPDLKDVAGPLGKEGDFPVKCTHWVELGNKSAFLLLSMLLLFQFLDPEQ